PTNDSAKQVTTERATNPLFDNLAEFARDTFPLILARLRVVRRALAGREPPRWLSAARRDRLNSRLVRLYLASDWLLNDLNGWDDVPELELPAKRKEV